LQQQLNANKNVKEQTGKLQTGVDTKWAKDYEATHPGTVIDKNGKIIQQTQKVGGRGFGEVKTGGTAVLRNADVPLSQASKDYSAKQSGTWKPNAIEDKDMVKQMDDAAAKLRAENALLSNFNYSNKDLINSGINPVQAKGNREGAGDVRIITTDSKGNVTSKSGNSDYYNNLLGQKADQKAQITKSQPSSKDKDFVPFGNELDAISKIPGDLQKLGGGLLKDTGSEYNKASDYVKNSVVGKALTPIVGAAIAPFDKIHNATSVESILNRRIKT
jgi:hypothetical protein